MEIGGVGVYRGRSRSVQGGEAGGGSGRRGGWGWLGTADDRERAESEKWLKTAGQQRAESEQRLGTTGRQRAEKGEELEKNLVEFNCLRYSGPEHHGRVRGYGDGVTPTELWGSSSSSIRDLQRQLKESEEKRKENDADLQRQLKESEEKRKESDAHLKILEAQVNQVESLLAVVMKKLSPPELAQSESST
uniref:Uncharacterized protein n=1 Tax=Fagus sylvatica TaxID=28930 RepID=A0A2N9GND0_FAGSY